MIRKMTFLFQKPRGQRGAVFQSPLCNKPSPNLLVKNNKHFIICNDFVGWLVSVGCSSFPHDIIWTAVLGAGISKLVHLHDWQQVLAICRELSSWQEHPSFLHVSFLNPLICCQLHGMWVVVVLKEACSWEGPGSSEWKQTRSTCVWTPALFTWVSDIRTSWIVWACGFCILNYSTAPAKERLCISYQILIRSEEWWFAWVLSPEKQT